MCRAVNEIADSRPSAYSRTNVEHRGAMPRENWRHSRIPIFSAIGSPKEKKNYNRRGRLPLFYAFSKRRSADVESGIFGSCFAKWHRETDSRDKRTREREGRDALRGYLHKFVISTRRRASTVRDLDGSRNPRVSTTWRRVSGGEEFRPADLCSSSWALLCRAASGIARIISISSRANFASRKEVRFE